MSKISKSPDRYTFQAKSSEEKLKKNPNDRNARAMVEMYKQWREDADARTQDLAWQKNNMEYDMRSAEWMCAKARASEAYSQNIYAALCNNEFQKLAVLPILKNERWSCSWRHAGGIVADMREEGDYIDWYCSGIAGGDEPDVYGQGNELHRKGYVPECVVTDEIKNDLAKLGWVVVDDMDNK